MTHVSATIPFNISQRGRCCLHAPSPTIINVQKLRSLRPRDNYLSPIFVRDRPIIVKYTLLNSSTITDRVH